MIKNQNVELFSSTFFFLTNEETRNLVEIFNASKDYTSTNSSLRSILSRFKFINLNQISLQQDSVEKILLITFAEEFILRNLHQLLMDEENSKKLEAVVKRKQYESKILNEFKKCLVHIIYHLNGSLEKVLTNIFFSLKPRLDINIIEMENEIILSTLKDFKREIDGICPGISNKVYLDLNKYYYSNKNEVLELMNNYFIKKYNYDYVKANNSYDHLNKNNMIYSDYILLNCIKDYETISIGLHRSSLVNFFCKITKYNSFTYVEKIIDVLMNYIKNKYPDYHLVIDNNLPLHLLDSEYLNQMSKQIFKYHFTIFKQYDLKIISKYENNMMLLNDINSSDINKGKSLLKSIISEVYPNYLYEVMHLFDNPKSEIVYTAQFNNASKTTTTFSNYLENSVYDLLRYPDERKFLDLKYDYYNEEKILNRLYYSIFVLNELDSKSINSMFHTIYGRILLQQGFESKYQLDTSKRDEKYNQLKEILLNYSLKLSDKYRYLYISALLDAKVATIEEQEIYKELEQKGDAIYQLVCNENLFYNEEIEGYDSSDIDNLIKAESQIEIAKKITLDKLYITNYSIDETSDIVDSQTNYLADSLEMIIGAISIEFGVVTAISFTHDLLESKLDKISEYEFEGNESFHARCYPSCNEIDSNYNTYHNIDIAITKFVLMYCYGNNNIEKRRKIANFISPRNLIYKENNKEYMLHTILLKEYLCNGINYIYDKYKDKIDLK